MNPIGLAPMRSRSNFDRIVTKFWLPTPTTKIKLNSNYNPTRDESNSESSRIPPKFDRITSNFHLSTPRSTTLASEIAIDADHNLTDNQSRSDRKPHQGQLPIELRPASTMPRMKMGWRRRTWFNRAPNVVQHKKFIYIYILEIEKQNLETKSRRQVDLPPLPLFIIVAGVEISCGCICSLTKA